MGALESSMSTIAKVLELAGVAPDATTVSRAQRDAAIAIAFAQGEASAVENMKVNAAKTANVRIAAILKHPNASGREQIARHLAFETNMAPEAAVMALATTPQLLPVRQSRLFAVPNPKVDLGSDGTGLNDASSAGGTLSASIDRSLAKMGLAPVGRHK